MIFEDEDILVRDDSFLVSSMTLVYNRHKFYDQICELYDGEHEPDLALEQAWNVLEAVVRRMACTSEEPISTSFHNYLSLAQFIGLTLYMPHTISCKFTKITIWRGIMYNLTGRPYEECQGEALIEFRRLINKCDLDDVKTICKKLKDESPVTFDVIKDSD